MPLTQLNDQAHIRMRRSQYTTIHIEMDRDFTRFRHVHKSISGFTEVDRSVSKDFDSLTPSSDHSTLSARRVVWRDRPSCDAARRGKGPTSATREERSATDASKRNSNRPNRNGSRVVHIRVWPSEEAAMRRGAESRGLALASFVRLSALHMAGAPTGAEFETLRLPEAIGDLHGVANNLNQLARAANRARGIVMSGRDRIVMAELAERVEEVCDLFLEYRMASARRPGLLILPTGTGDR